MSYEFELKYNIRLVLFLVIIFSPNRSCYVNFDVYQISKLTHHDDTLYKKSECSKCESSHNSSTTFNKCILGGIICVPSNYSKFELPEKWKASKVDVVLNVLYIKFQLILELLLSASPFHILR